MNYTKITKGWFDYQNLYLDFVLKAPLNSTIIELGTFAGKSFAFLLEAAILKEKPLNLYSIDNYSGAGGEKTNYFEALSNVSYVENLISRQHPAKYLRWKEFGGNWQLIHSNSLELELTEFNNIFAVFCDTDHDYKTISSEISKYYPEIMIGGFIAGHDFNPSNPLDFPDVQKAVFEFARQHDLTILEYPPRSFAIQKLKNVNSASKKQKIAKIIESIEEFKNLGA